uniref:U-scoloptoxin(05)-Ssd1a n=1 Tax=Scolopendra dehaani TaxID=2609776 RepID=TX51A_SCODE|nr:RecName: Full=U-scoloptoxin(05)-Ssd1a; Short=U-SLPTX(05)-Ssd1a; AltName: Full=Toxin SSD202; Flags: Precursor [Scolopendra dehaani]
MKEAVKMSCLCIFVFLFLFSLTDAIKCIKCGESGLFGTEDCVTGTFEAEECGPNDQYCTKIILNDGTRTTAQRGCSVGHVPESNQKDGKVSTHMSSCNTDGCNAN